MAIMDASALPPGRDHLDPEDRERLRRCARLAAERRFGEAADLVEELWGEAFDAHKQLYRGLANALKAVCARERGQTRGARQIAAATHELLRPLPARVLGLDLDLLLASMDAFVATGRGSVDLAAED